MWKLSFDKKNFPSTVSPEEMENLTRWFDIMEKAVVDTMMEQLANIAAFGISHPEILKELPSMDPTDFEIIALRNELHEAAKIADQRLKAMPDHLTIADEMAEIDAIMAPCDEMAGRMFSLKPTTPEGIDAKVRAGLWKTGNYIMTYLGAE
jgi:hypothetical protein